MKRVRPLFFLALFLLPLPTIGADAALSSEQEARAQALFHQLHCVVCSGQSLAGSDARIAHDLRALVRQRIHEGESDQAIIDYLVTRYGEEILMEPPLKTSTLPLWLAPLLLFLTAVAFAWRTVFRHKAGHTR